MKNDYATNALPEKPRRDPETLMLFVADAREKQPYSGVVWDAAMWNISSADVKKRAHHLNKASLIFTEHAGPRVPVEARSPFMPGFADVVKACIVRRRLNRGMESSSQLVLVRATRYLYAVLPLPARHDPSLINRGHFVAAENAILEREAPSSAYRAATLLAEFAGTLDRYGVCRNQIDFRSSVKKPTEHIDRTSSTFEQRVKGLPTAAVLDALAAISNDPGLVERPFDLLRVRIAELLVVCGFRIGEGLTMPSSPAVREAVADEAGPIRLDALTGEPVERLGLRYWPEKGGEPVVKWVPTVANALVLRALEDIERICLPARENAQWLERHPGDVNIDIGPEERLPLRRATEILGLAEKQLFQWLNARERGGRRLVIGRGIDAYIRGSDFRKAIASDRYEKPVLVREDGRRQTLGQSLFVVFFHSTNQSRATNRYISMPVTGQQMHDFLCGRGDIASIFERQGYRDDAGKPYRIRTHDFRRLLNMIAQRGGLTQTEIAQWMGRRRVSDNAAYDLRTPTEMAAEMRELVTRNEVYGVIADQVQALPEAERGAFLESRLAMIHTTPHGECASNIAESPCATAMSCLGGCRQYLRRKGDAKSRESLLRIERKTLIALNNAREAMAAGKFNAENWVRAQETILKTTRAALAIDDDPSANIGDARHVSPDGPLIGEAL